MCTYNGQKYIVQQLESIKEQTVPVDEIIICDDCSTDQTVLIIKEYINNFSIPIRLYVNHRNLGYTHNFEKAISLCCGDIIFLSDQDDIWLPHKVETICNYFKCHPTIDFVFTNGILINAFGVNTYAHSLFETVGFNSYNKKIFDQGLYFDVIGLYGRVTGATSAMRASFVPDCIPFPKTSVFASIHDEIIAVRAAYKNKIGYIDKQLIKYRLHPDQSVGLALMMKFPPQSWEKADLTILWHETLADSLNTQEIETIRFMNKRFWAARSPQGIWNICALMLSGQYKRMYPLCYKQVFRRDIKGILVRTRDCFKRIFLKKSESYS